jgi:hypothetical protein
MKRLQLLSGERGKRGFQRQVKRVANVPHEESQSMRKVGQFNNRIMILSRSVSHIHMFDICLATTFGLRVLVSLLLVGVAAAQEETGTTFVDQPLSASGTLS